MAPAAAQASEQPHAADLDAMIIKEAQRHGIPERLVRRVVMRESRYNPRARNHKYWGLMQISYPTARSMGFRGTPEELLNPLTNLTYAVPYLANAFIAAGKHEDAAVRLYASGYYDTARRHGLLGLMRTADSTPLQGFHDEVAAAPAPSSSGIFGALFGSSDPAPAPALTQEPAPQYASAAPPPAPVARPNSGAPAPSAGTTIARSDAAPGDTDMVFDKAGHLEPPKRWRHDGGYTVIARGEQGDTHRVASADSDSQSRRHAGRHTRKVTEFASAELPASAQAYAATANEPAPPQAAIEQAVSGNPQGERPAVAAASGETASGATAPPTAATSSETGSAKAVHHHHIARSRSTHHTAVAKATVPASSAAPAKAMAELK